MTKATLNKNGIATKAGDMVVYNYDAVTHEYLSSSVEYLVVGVGIPAHSCTDAPGQAKEGSAICRTVNFNAWEYVADHRGETVYNTETGEAMTINFPNDYPDNTTPQAPATPYDTWNGSKWITNTVAQHAMDMKAAEQKKSVLLTEAQVTISLWQTELQLGIISDKDRARLILWLNYIKDLQAVIIEAAPNINWPAFPG